MGLELGGRSFDSRLIMGTGGFRNLELMAEAGFLSFETRRRNKGRPANGVSASARRA